MELYWGWCFLKAFLEDLSLVDTDNDAWVMKDEVERMHIMRGWSDSLLRVQNLAVYRAGVLMER